MQQLLVLPLYTMGNAVLPGETFPLCCFEPTQISLVRYCLGDNPLRQEQAFGLIRVRGGEIAEFGCLATVSQVLQEFEDGRSVILGRGTTRFRIRALVPATPFPQAVVELPCEENESGIERLQFGIISKMEEFLSLKGGEQLESPGGSPLLSFRLAGCVGLDPAEKQELLDAANEVARLRCLEAFLNFRVLALRHCESGVYYDPYGQPHGQRYDQ